LLKLALQEIEDPEPEGEEENNSTVDDELRLKQLLWHFITKLRKFKIMKEKINYSHDLDSDISMNMEDEDSNTNNNYFSISEKTYVDQIYTHRVKRHTSGRSSYHHDDIINDSYGEESNDNDHLIENINQIDEEMSKFDYTPLYENNNPMNVQIRCQAPDPISMIVGDNRYSREDA